MHYSVCKVGRTAWFAYDDDYYYPCFMAEETEAQRDLATCPRLRSKWESGCEVWALVAHASSLQAAFQLTCQEPAAY